MGKTSATTNHILCVPITICKHVQLYVLLPFVCCQIRRADTRHLCRCCERLWGGDDDELAITRIGTLTSKMTLNKKVASSRRAERRVFFFRAAARDVMTRGCRDNAAGERRAKSRARCCSPPLQQKLFLESRARLSIV